MAFGADKTLYDPETRVYTTKCRKVAFGCNKWLRIDLNPVVTIISAGLIWGLVIWCIVDPEGVSKFFPCKLDPSILNSCVHLIAK